jgi:DNA-binding response OmpR family regulator
MNALMMSGVGKSMAQLWILEDDEDAIRLYEKIFHPIYETQYFKSLSDLKTAIGTETKKPELLIADLRLPDGNFMQFLESMAKAITMPFAIVSAADDFSVLKDCFKKGARDFFVKPFNQNEILYKVNRILQGAPSETSQIKFKDLTLDTYAQNVTRSGLAHQIQLTQTEYKILSLFFRNADRRLNREEIIGEVWKSEALSPKAFDFHLSKLREKLRELSAKINYQASEGYCLVQE